MAYFDIDIRWLGFSNALLEFTPCHDPSMHQEHPL